MLFVLSSKLRPRWISLWLSCQIDLGQLSPSLAPMIVRISALLLLTVGCCWGKAETAVTARLKAELKEAHPYVPPAAPGGDTDLGGDPVFHLEPMTVTSSSSFEVDLQAEARRAAAAREARKFSPQKGGLIFSSGRMDLGFWPKLVPVESVEVGSLKKQTVGISVDLLRIKW